MNVMATSSNNGKCMVCPDCLECITCGLCKCGHSKRINMEHLAHAIRTMSNRSKLYKIIKDEVKRRGHWKDLRGRYDSNTQTKKNRN